MKQVTAQDNLLYPLPPEIQRQADGPPQNTPNSVYSEARMWLDGVMMTPGETCFVDADFNSEQKLVGLRRMGAVDALGTFAGAMPDNDTDDNLIRY